MNGAFCTRRLQSYQINTLKNSTHTAKPGSKANLEGFVSVILRLKGFCLKLSCTRSASKQSHDRYSPSQPGGPAVLEAHQQPCKPLAFTASPKPRQWDPGGPTATRVPRPLGARARRDVGSTAAGEPISSRSRGCTTWKRLMPRTQRQGKFAEGGTEKQNKSNVPASKK